MTALLLMLGIERLSGLMGFLLSAGTPTLSLFPF